MLKVNDKSVKSKLKVRLWIVLKRMLLKKVLEAEASADVFKKIGGIEHNQIQTQPNLNLQF